MADTLPEPGASDELRLIFDELSKLPLENQKEIARFLRAYVVEQNSPSLLTVEQVAEVRRRLADPDPVYHDQEDVFAEIEAMLDER